jgi:hypothetical protein
MDFIESASTVRELTLTFADALDPLLAIAPSQRSFGSGSQVEQGRVRVRIGERPIVRDLKRLYRKAGKTLPTDFEVFSAYNIWMILFAVGIVRESGMREVDRFGFAVTFPEKPRVTVLNILPQTRFVKRAGAILKAEATLSLNGSAQVPEVVSQVLTATDALSADASLNVSTEANVFGTLSFSVLTSAIQAIGTGDRRAEWVFEKAEQPLVGDQHLAVTLLAPKQVDEIEVTTQLSASVSVFNLLPCKLETEFVLYVPLE